MSNSHTPGPWRVARHGKDGQEIIVESTVARTPEFDDGCGDYFPVVADLYRGGTGNIHDAKAWRESQEIKQFGSFSPIVCRNASQES